MESVLATRSAGLLFGLLIWAMASWAGAAVSPAATQPTNLALTAELGWVEQSAQLVQAAQSSQSDAVQFNKDVRESRARLRKIIQQARSAELPEEHRQLHSILLVLNVLLKSAAACQAGGHIVCPPMLISQLNTVLKNAYAKLDVVRASTNYLSNGATR